MVHMALICNTKNWKEKESRPDDVRDSFHGNMCNVMCGVGSTQNTGLAIETLEGTKAGVDSGDFLPSQPLEDGQLRIHSRVVARSRRGVRRYTALAEGAVGGSALVLPIRALLGQYSVWSQMTL